MSYLVFDAEENGIVRLVDDDGEEREIPRGELPETASEGDCLLYSEQNGWQVDTAETAARRERLRQKRMRLLGKRQA